MMVKWLTFDYMRNDEWTWLNLYIGYIRHRWWCLILHYWEDMENKIQNLILFPQDFTTQNNLDTRLPRLILGKEQMSPYVVNVHYVFSTSNVLSKISERTFEDF